MAKKDDQSIFDYIKKAYSTCLLIFSIVIVMGLIFSHNTRLAHDVHPALAFVMIWICLIWLNMVEGSQGSFVGLPPVNKELYEHSHPIAFQCCTLAHKGDNLDRYLTGRQFMVILIVFVTNMAGAPLDNTASVFGFPEWLSQMFLHSGLAMILMTAMAGQLNSQVNASHCMLDYIDNYFALFTLYTALAVEFTGVFHSCYAIQIVIAKLAGNPIHSQEPPKTTLQSLFFWARVVFSFAILGFGFAVTVQALFHGQTTMWDGVPPTVSVVLFFTFLCIIGLLEGMQIAFFAVAKLPKDERGNHKIAQKTCQLLFQNGGRNLAGFMIGRQLCVTLCFFVVARVTSLNINVDDGDEPIFGVSKGVQAFFNTGLLAAVITTVIGSITWQLIASAFPIAFLSNPAVFLLLNICLFLEATGICSGAWVLAAIHARIAGFQRDEAYVGTPEERAARAKEDHSEFQLVQPGHPRLPVFRTGTNQVGNFSIEASEVDEDEELDAL